jgi:membrane peptidoglycan carboxypeptidase
VGYSPYYTAAIWFGFDKPGNSLGVNLTGSTLSGPVWADFMREVHRGLPFKDFVKPSTGIVEVTVCAKSGLLKTAACPSGITLPFLEGTAPVRYCDQHDSGGSRSPVSREGRRRATLFMDNSALLGELRLPELNLPELRLPEHLRQGDQATPTQGTATRGTSSRSARARSSTRSSTRSTPASVPSRSASQPALDFRGSDYEGELPPMIPVEPGLDAEDPRDSQDGFVGEVGQQETPETAPAAAPRNTRNNPAIFEEGFILDTPDYNPLLD